MAFTIINKYPERYIPATTAALTAIAIGDISDIRDRMGKVPQIEVTADGADVVVAFGDSTVAANLTVDATTRQRDESMYLLKDGAVLVFDVPDTRWTHISTITPTGSGNLILRQGFGQ